MTVIEQHIGVSDHLHVSTAQSDGHSAVGNRVISKARSTQAAANLAAFFKDNNLFAHGSQELVARRDREYVDRCHQEAARDRRVAAIVGTVPDPIVARKAIETAREKRAAKIVVTERPHPNVVKRPPVIVDPTHIDYRDPADFYRTRLHKAVIDNDIRRVKFHVSKEKANLDVVDSDGLTPRSLALSEGHTAIANFLKVHRLKLIEKTATPNLN